MSTPPHTPHRPFSHSSSSSTSSPAPSECRARSARTSSLTSMTSLSPSSERQCSTHADYPRRRGSASSSTSRSGVLHTSTFSPDKRVLSHGSTLADELGALSDEEEEDEAELAVQRTRRRRRRSTARSRMSMVSTAEDDFASTGRVASHATTLADELGSGSDSDEVEGEWDETHEHGAAQGGEAERDSGVDMHSASRSTVGVTANPAPKVRNFSRPHPRMHSPPAAAEEREEEDKMSPELERAMADIAQLAVYKDTDMPSTVTDSLVSALRTLSSTSADILGPAVQRLATGTSSIALHLGSASRSLAPPLAMTPSLSPSLSSLAPASPTSANQDQLMDNEPDLSTLLDALLASLPRPDQRVPRALAHLARDTSTLQGVLARLLDDLQEERQVALQAARVLAGALRVVRQLRGELGRADEARAWIEKFEAAGRGGSMRRALVGEGVLPGGGRCRDVCAEVVGGFEGVCEGWRRRLEEGMV